MTNNKNNEEKKNKKIPSCFFIKVSNLEFFVGAQTNRDRKKGYTKKK
jgi:hypothetical protein